MRPTLAAEIRAFLRERGPATVSEIRSAVRARRVDVDEILASDDFAFAKRPVGGSGRARYFNVSRRVPQGNAGLSRRARVLLDALLAGKSARPELTAALAAAGVSTYTNNAAAELRAAGWDVRSERRGGQVFYRLVSSEPSEAAA